MFQIFFSKGSELECLFHVASFPSKTAYSFAVIFCALDFSLFRMRWLIGLIVKCFALFEDDFLGNRYYERLYSRLGLFPSLSYCTGNDG